MTNWSLDYILDFTTLDQLMMIHEYGRDFEETKSIIFLNKVAELLTGKTSKKTKKITSNIDPDKPDLKKFNRLYGNIIKTPNKEK